MFDQHVSSPIQHSQPQISGMESGQVPSYHLYQTPSPCGSGILPWILRLQTPGRRQAMRGWLERLGARLDKMACCCHSALTIPTTGRQYLDRGRYLAASIPTLGKEVWSPAVLKLCMAQSFRIPEVTCTRLCSQHQKQTGQGRCAPVETLPPSQGPDGSS